MVAKSYQKLNIATEPYMVNGKMYVKVDLGNGVQKQVRWYTPNEYKKLYGELPADYVDPYYKSQREVLGFIDGFITIFKGNTYDNKEWFKEIGCTYRKWWGWSLPSNMELPAELPEGVEALRLEWSAVGADEENLKPEDQVAAVVQGMIYEPSTSEYQGEIGAKVQVELTVINAVALNGYYGPSTMHIMEDINKNVYVWTTASKCWSVGTVHNVKGTVKDHKEYKGTKQTILTRCTEVKK